MFSFTCKYDTVGAIKIGLARSGDVTVVITDEHLAALTLEERETLAAMYKDALERGFLRVLHGSVEEILQIVWERVAELETIRLANEERERELDRQAAAILANPSCLVRAITHTTEAYGDTVMDPGVRYEGWVWENTRIPHSTELAPLFEAAKKAAHDSLNEHRSHVSSVIAAETAKRDSEARALAAERRARLEEHISSDPTALERWDAGVYPMSELEDLVEREAFAPLEGRERYERLIAADIDHDDDCTEPGNGHFSSSTLEKISGHEWQDVIAVRAMMPDAVVTPRQHRATCLSCNESATRNGLMVEITVLGIKMRCELELAL